METEFAKRLAMLRQEKGLTQQRLADKLGLTAQAISKYETGGSLPEIDTLKAIATVLGCSTDYLLGHELIKESQVDMLLRERSEEIDRALHREALYLNVGKGNAGMGPLVEMLMEENKNHYDKIHRLRVKLASEYGILIPVIRLRDQAGLAEDEYEIALHGRTVLGRGVLKYPMQFHIGEKAADETQLEGEEPVWHKAGVWRAAGTKQKTGASRPAEAGQMPETGAKEGVQVQNGTAAAQETAVPSGEDTKICQPLTCMDIVVAHLEKLILENYDRILNRQLVWELTEKARSWYPASINGIIPEKVSLARLQRAIGALIRERIPVNRLDIIIDFLEEHPENSGEDIGKLKELLRL